ncbi:hypothetical protein F4604DRAFT_1736445 [Suillus subluteus]|nr:hypothetical protein F4604DRAFT_1736445 [Suillus subluteus]
MAFSSSTSRLLLPPTLLAMSEALPDDGTPTVSSSVLRRQYHAGSLLPVVNYITAHTLVCIYPKWTKEKNWVNPAVYLDDVADLR